MSAVFVHQVTFSWLSSAPADQNERMGEALSRLRMEVPHRHYLSGADTRLRAGNADFGVVAIFQSQDDYLLYADHPSHLALIAEHVTPNLSSRQAVQYASTLD